MQNFAVADILQAANGQLIKGNTDTIVKGISTDSRTLVAGEFFAALVGEKFDGHNFIDQAVNRKMAGVLVSRDVGEIPVETVIQVKDTLKALGDIARLYRDNFSIPVIGITGSNGKTTTKDMTASVLAERFSVLKNEGNFNNAIGVPLTLFELCREHEVAVIEMGTGAPGEIPRLVEIARPDVAVVTNVSPTHQMTFGSVDAVAKEKGVLVQVAKSAVLNADDPLVAKMRDLVDGNAVMFGMAGNTCANVLADEVTQSRDGKTLFTIIMDDEKIRINLPAVGKHNVYNALAAASVSRILELESSEIKAGLESYQGTPMRMQVITAGGVKIINDTYNSNPASLRAAIDFLSTMECDGKKIAVIGDMLELGEQAEKYHGEAGSFIANSPVDVLVTMGEKARGVAEAALGANKPKDKVIICNTNSQAIASLQESLAKGDIVLIKGSRGMKMEEIVEALKKELEN